MCQDGEMFVNMLNKIRVGETKSEDVEDVIKLHFTDRNDPYYPGNIMHIFAENAPVKRQCQSIETHSRTANHNTCKR